MTDYVIHPLSFINRLKSINGIEVLKFSHRPEVYLVDAIEFATELTEGFDGEEIGSSDFTFYLQGFINTLLDIEKLSSKYKTDFTPYLSVVEK